MKKNKKPIILVTAILLAVVTAFSAATFAWFTSRDQVLNRIETAHLADGDVTIYEAFDPEIELKPGVDINKDVGAINTGDTPVLVRISFTEVLKKLMPVPGAGDYATMGVRNATKWVSVADLLASPPVYDEFMPQTVDPDKFDGTWTTISDATELAAWMASETLLYNDPASITNFANLLGQGIVFKVKKTDATPGARAFAWSAYVKVTMNGIDCYQRVELRPELFNIVYQDNVIANLTTGPSPVRDVANVTIYGETGIQVVLTDPLTPSIYDNGVLDPNIAAVNNNGAGRFYNYMTLQLVNGGEGYKADWRKAVAAPGVPSPVGSTPPPASKFITAATPADLFETMTAVTDDANGKLRLVFQAGQVILTIPGTTDTKWYYNPADGYFYYCALLEPGDYTELLLDAIRLTAAAENDYAYTAFDLLVCMDAIQATKEAVTSTVGGGWALSGALATFLQGLCPS